MSEHTPGPAIWLIYSREHNAFWRPNARGYTTNIDHAGRYTREEAYIHCETRDSQPDGGPSEVAVIAPETAAERDRLREALERIEPGLGRGYAPDGRETLGEIARAALDGTAPSEAEKLREINGELVKALHRLHAWGEPFIKKTPISAETLWREFPAAMKHAEEILAKAWEAQP